MGATWLFGALNWVLEHVYRWLRAGRDVGMRKVRRPGWAVYTPGIEWVVCIDAHDWVLDHV
jgi:hypothetical protein